MLAAHLFPENMDWQGWLFLGSLIALGLLGPPVAFVLIFRRVFARRRERFLTLDVGRQSDGRVFTSEAPEGARGPRADT